jgi:uncharacterized protein YxjI
MPPDPAMYVLNQKLMSLSGDLWIEDAQGNNAFEVDGKAFTLRRTLLLLDLQGNQLYAIGQSLAHLHRTFEIKHGETIVATIQESLFNLLGDHFTITLADASQLSVQGNWLDREFHVSQGGSDVIVASRKWLTVHDAYGIQIAPGFETPLGLAIVVALEQMELQGHEHNAAPGIGGVLGGALGGVLGGGSGGNLPGF